MRVLSLVKISAEWIESTARALARRFTGRPASVGDVGRRSSPVVVWPRHPEIIRSRLIGYVWDPTLAIGTVQKSQKMGTVMFIVVRSTTAQLGPWLSERRNVVEDFRRFRRRR